MIAVHSPEWSPFYARTNYLLVNVLGREDGGWKLEIKTTLIGTDFEWDFGDLSGPLIDGYEVTHTFEAPGSFTITVKVDGDQTETITIDLPGPDGNGHREAEVLPLPKRAKVA